MPRIGFLALLRYRLVRSVLAHPTFTPSRFDSISPQISAVFPVCSFAHCRITSPTPQATIALEPCEPCPSRVVVYQSRFASALAWVASSLALSSSRSSSLAIRSSFSHSASTLQCKHAFAPALALALSLTLARTLSPLPSLAWDSFAISSPLLSRKGKKNTDWNRYPFPHTFTPHLLTPHTPRLPQPPRSVDFFTESRIPPSPPP